MDTIYIKTRELHISDTVDIIGSVIFGHSPRKRYIPGIGSSMVPEILKKAKIDDVVMIDDSIRDLKRAKHDFLYFKKFYCKPYRFILVKVFTGVNN